MPSSEKQTAQQMRHKVRDMREQFRKGQGNETETASGFRNRILGQLEAVPAGGEFESALPGRFRSYLIRDPEEIRSRGALGSYLQSQLVEAQTADLAYSAYPMPAAAERIRSTVRYYLEHTGRKQLAEEFDRVMEVEPDTEMERRLRIQYPELGHNTEGALAALKQEKAYARGAMLAKLSEEFSGMTPETLEQPVSDADYRRLSRPYLYLNALASQMGTLLTATDRKSDILFTPQDRKKCSHLVAFQPVTDRVVRQMEVMSNPCYRYLEVNDLIHNMDHDSCNELCTEMAAKGGVAGSFALEVKAVQETSLGYTFEEAATEAENAIKAVNIACTEGMDQLKKEVKNADPFYLLQGSPEYDALKKSVEEYSANRMPDIKDPGFLKKLRGMAQATKKLYRDSSRYLKHKETSSIGRHDRKRIDAAKAVREYAVKQMEQLKKLRRLKNVMDDFGIEEARKSMAKERSRQHGSVRMPAANTTLNRSSQGRRTVRNEKLSHNAQAQTFARNSQPAEEAFSRSEFYKQGKKFVNYSFRQENENTNELNRRLKLMFFPDREFDLYGALGLDRQVEPGEPLLGMELATARELISHLTMKQVLRDEQRRAAKSGSPSKIDQLAKGIPVDDFREFMGETPSLEKALENISREDVYRLVAGEDRKALKELSRKVALELPAVAEAHLDKKVDAPEKNHRPKLSRLGEQRLTITGKGPAMQ